MSDQEEMEKLGFTRDGHTYRSGHVTIRFGYGAVRPWYAMKGRRSLHGAAGCLRKFSSPAAAARAAMCEWQNQWSSE